MDRLDSAGRVMLEMVLKEARHNVEEWQGELRKKIEEWTAASGLTASDPPATLDLIDQLRGRGVKTFEGLGIKVSF